MALVGSGWISIAEISAEFGSYGNPRWLSWYYRGAGLVPNTSRNASIPTGGTIWLSQFYGSSVATSGSYHPRALGWTSFTWPAYENMDVYVYGAGGGGGGASYIYSYQYTYMQREPGGGYLVTRWQSEPVFGSDGGKGGDSIFQCNGFNVSAIGGNGGTQGQSNASDLTDGANGAWGYGVNGNVNQTGGGGGGGAGTYWGGNWIHGGGGKTFMDSRGGNGGNGGYAKRSLAKGGYGAYNRGVVTSVHVGPGGAGGFTGGSRYTDKGQAAYGGQGWIDIYWS
ncbi:hypothetical protein phiOC_p045 [Ochrobactrum phage vB_OspM_OC]|nr:hypothetical protein phiOC_p045 [Ochrobactrum phage vB_OspM_OC]